MDSALKERIFSQRENSKNFLLERKFFLLKVVPHLKGGNNKIAKTFPLALYIFILKTFKIIFITVFFGSKMKFIPS